MGSSFFLPKIVGWGCAAEMCMTGERVRGAGHRCEVIGQYNHNMVKY